MDMILRWNDKKGLKKYADELLKTYPELNKKYPERRNKPNTYIVYFNGIENNAGAGLLKNQPLNKEERGFYEAMSVDSNIGDVIFKLDFEVIVNKMTLKQQFVLNRRLEGYTQQEIANLMNISRKNLIKHLEALRKKTRHFYEQ